METDVEISILLFDKDCREINIHLVKKGFDYIEYESLTPEYLWGCQGGLEIVIDGYKIILRNFEFYVSLNVIDFLLNTYLYHYGQLTNEWKNEDFSNSIVQIFPSQNILRLDKVNKKTYRLSYTKGKNSLQNPFRFFDYELLSADKLILAIDKALIDYFQIFDKVINDYPTNTKTKILNNYFKERRKIMKNTANKA